MKEAAQHELVHLTENSNWSLWTFPTSNGQNVWRWECIGGLKGGFFWKRRGWRGKKRLEKLKAGKGKGWKTKEEGRVDHRPPDSWNETQKHKRIYFTLIFARRSYSVRASPLSSSDARLYSLSIYVKKYNKFKN